MTWPYRNLGIKKAKTLQDEMGKFRIKVDKDGKENLQSWREGSHDDLVLAVTTATWAGERLVLAELVE